jgi:hypothetical protein
VEPKVSLDVVTDEEPKKVEEEAQSQSEPPLAPALEHVEQGVQSVERGQPTVRFAPVGRKL